MYIEKLLLNGYTIPKREIIFYPEADNSVHHLLQNLWCIDNIFWDLFILRILHFQYHSKRTPSDAISLMWFFFMLFSIKYLQCIFYVLYSYSNHSTQENRISALRNWPLYKPISTRMSGWNSRHPILSANGHTCWRRRRTEQMNISCRFSNIRSICGKKRRPHSHYHI